jgi:PD-(D/E)XK nuclease superfamily
METDRSRVLSFQRCPRERYYAYHHLGTGIQKESKGLPLQFGSAFHEGAEVLLTSDSRSRIDYAVQRARAFLIEQFSSHSISFDNETPDDIQKAMEYGQEEQMALAEGLLRGWWAYEGESFLNTFEVVEVEQEGRAALIPTSWVGVPDPLVLMFRPDAVVREKSTGDHYIISWKTASTFSPRNVKQARTDMQSISEVFGVMQDRGIKVEGVLYKWAIKGQRRKDNWDNLYKQSSHLIYGWKKLGNGGGDEAEWSWVYEFEKEDGSGSSRLGKGWQKKPIWRDYPGGVKQWIKDLSKGEVFPRHIDALQAIFPQSLPVERRKDEVKSWKHQVEHQELEIGRKLGTIEYHEQCKADKVVMTELIDRLFPQYTSSCHSFSGCSFIDVCWNGAPAEVGDLYQIRLSNHPEEGDGDE